MKGLKQTLTNLGNKASELAGSASRSVRSAFGTATTKATIALSSAYHKVDGVFDKFIGWAEGHSDERMQDKANEHKFNHMTNVFNAKFNNFATQAQIKLEGAWATVCKYVPALESKQAKAFYSAVANFAVETANQAAAMAKSVYNAGASVVGSVATNAQVARTDGVKAAAYGQFNDVKGACKSFVSANGAATRSSVLDVMLVVSGAALGYNAGGAALGVVGAVAGLKGGAALTQNRSQNMTKIIALAGVSLVTSAISGDYKSLPVVAFQVALAGMFALEAYNMSSSKAAQARQ